MDYLKINTKIFVLLTFIGLFLLPYANVSKSQTWLGVKYSRGLDSEINYWGGTAGFGIGDNPEWGLGGDWVSTNVNDVTVSDGFGYLYYRLDPVSEGSLLVPYAGFGRTCAEVTTDGESSQACNSGFTLGGRLFFNTGGDVWLAGVASYISGGETGRIKLGIELSFGADN